jgi:serine/threonine protein kinase
MAATLKGGLVLGKWKLGKRIGSGGQGEVWEVRLVSGAPGPPRALKVCLATEPRQRERFAREVALLKGLSHNGHVIPLIDSELDWKHEPKTGLTYSFYVTERFDGSLDGFPWLQRAPLLALRLFRELCDAVEFLHVQQPALIHRDIKPSNTFFGSEPYRLALGDLGIAHEEANEEALTATHEVVGSRNYRAPEIMMGGKGDVRSDVYSLGRTLEWILVGQAPDLPTPREVPASSEISPATRELLNTVLRTACALNADARYQSVAQLKAALPAFHVEIAGVPPAPSRQVDGPPSFADAAEAYTQTKSILSRRVSISWREIEKTRRGSVQAVMLTWRQKYERLVPRTLETWTGAFDELLINLGVTLASTLACAEFPDLALGDPVQLLRDVLHVAGWQQGGLTLLVEAPLWSVFAIHHLLGATAASVGNDALVADVAALRMPTTGAPALLREHQVTSWPRIFSDDANAAWRYLKDLPEKMPWLLALFGGELDFILALMAYRWQLSFLEFAQTTAVQSNVRIFFSVPGVIFHEPRETLERSYALAFPSRRALGALCARAGISVEHAWERWPEWLTHMKQNAKNSIPDSWLFLDRLEFPELPR